MIKASDEGKAESEHGSNKTETEIESERGRFKSLLLVTTAVLKTWVIERIHVRVKTIWNRVRRTTEWDCDKKLLTV